jgi:hypothetical protein
LKEVEAEIGRYAFAIIEDTGVMWVHPKLIERLRKLPADDVSEWHFRLAFPSPAAGRRLNEEWPSAVGKYRGQHNTEELLSGKSSILVAFVVNNLEFATAIYPQTQENAPDLKDEQKTSVRLDEAALWYRVVDELAQRYLGAERFLFMDYFIDWLVNRLALEGGPPELIINTLEDRGKECKKYQKWLPSDDESLRGTLLWEAAKAHWETI